MKKTISKLHSYKNSKKIVMITAYDALFAKLFDEIVDIILVGDSLNMSFFGEKDTLSTNLEQMIYHTKAVCNGAKSAYIITDMPFGTYSTPKEALQNGIKVFKETKADAIKIADSVYWVGVLDWDIRKYHGYTLKGTTYNAYLVFWD